MNFVSCPGNLFLNAPLIPRYTAASASANQVSVVVSLLYITYSARKNAAALNSGSNVRVMDGPGKRVDCSWRVTKGITANRAENNAANKTVSARWSCE